MEEGKSGAASGTEPSMEQVLARRREFLAAAQTLVSIAAIAGLGGVGLSRRATAQQSDEQSKVIDSVLDQAMKTGDIKGAIDQFGAEKVLPPEQLNALNSFSPEVLEALRTLQDGKAAEDNCNRGCYVF